jgi:putative transposase
MAYSIDLKKRVLEFVKDGGSKADAARRFSVGRTIIYSWLKNEDISKPKGRQVRVRKVSPEALAQDVLERPDDFLRERAARFGVRINAIAYRLATMKIVKKTAPVSRAGRYEKNDLRRPARRKREDVRRG